MIAVSLNIGGGIHVIKPAKTVHVHAKHYKRELTHGAGCVWQWFRTAESLGNVVTRIGLHTGTNKSSGKSSQAKCNNSTFCPYAPLAFGLFVNNNSHCEIS